MTSQFPINTMMLQRMLTVIILSLFLIACDGGPGSSPLTDEVGEDVDTYLQDLPDWEDFSPADPDQPPTPAGDPVNEAPMTLDVEKIDDEGNVYTEENVVYACQTQPYTLTDNPNQIAMYDPDRDVSWVGALIQGRSHRDGLGSFEGLTIEERAPINVSIPDLANDDNFRRVERPDQATVDQARGSMIGNATETGLATPSTISFEMQTYHSEQQAAMQMGLSGRYLGYNASATGAIDRRESETTVTAQFYQQMYTVVVGAPASPGAFFSEDFTSEKLQRLVDRGHIGPNNLPVYVSSIVYGRMMMFSMTSTASEEDVRATMQAGYQSIGGNVEANLSAKQQAILQESKIRVTSIGGPAEATLAIIRSGDWSQYFTESAPLSSASPLSYELRYLRDPGKRASVTESTTYNIKTCTARQATPGTFDLQDAQDLSLPIPTPVSSHVIDMDGDGNDDLVWNHLGSTNEVAIAFSNGDGTFAAPTTWAHPDTAPGGWGKYTLVTGLVDRNDRVDLIWNYADTRNRSFMAMSNGDGTFRLFSQVHNATNWGEAYSVHLADVNGTGVADLIWNERRTRNRTYVAMGAGDGSFSMVPEYQDHPNSNWHNYDLHVGDVDNDGRADLVWNETVDSGNRTYVGLYHDPTPGRHFRWLPVQDRGAGGWNPYTTLAGDVDGQNGLDLVFARLDMTVLPSDAPARVAIHRNISQGNGKFVFPPPDSCAQPAKTDRL
ncbi:MAG: thiol-activated cytolysin family protein [Longimonas sp.]|uniref:thiol-activated cytolysin family protein n=1 Tax=Longimonas sp. TaxID=2039626 RepID=UPI00397652B0